MHLSILRVGPVTLTSPERERMGSRIIRTNLNGPDDETSYRTSFILSGGCCADGFMRGRKINSCICRKEFKFRVTHSSMVFIKKYSVKSIDVKRIRI